MILSAADIHLLCGSKRFSFSDGDPKWYRFDDGDVTECKMDDDEEMKTQCFGGEQP